MNQNMEIDNLEDEYGVNLDRQTLLKLPTIPHYTGVCVCVWKGR